MYLYIYIYIYILWLSLICTYLRKHRKRNFEKFCFIWLKVSFVWTWLHNKNHHFFTSYLIWSETKFYFLNISTYSDFKEQLIFCKILHLINVKKSNVRFSEILFLFHVNLTNIMPYNSPSFLSLILSTVRPITVKQMAQLNITHLRNT